MASKADDRSGHGADNTVTVIDREREEVAEIRSLLRRRILEMLRKKNTPLRGSSMQEIIRFLRDYDAADVVGPRGTSKTTGSRTGGTSGNPAFNHRTWLDRLVSNADTAPQSDTSISPATIDDDGRIISSDPKQ